MTAETWQQIYVEMIDVIKRDNTITHIDLSFHISKVITEPKRAKINIKTFKDEHKKQY
jgi:hypothetical protein